MATKKKTATEKVLAYLSRRKTPATVFDIASKTGLWTDTVRGATLRLRKEGKIKQAGVDKTSYGGRGRPANTYIAV